MGYTTDDLLSSVRLRASCPSADSRFVDTNLLKIANEEMDTSIVPRLIRIREEYLVTSQDFTITDPNQTFRIPYRAVGAKLREVALVDTTSNPLRPTVINVPQLDLGDQEQQAWAGFYLQGNNVCMRRPASDGSTWPTNTLRMWYLLKPNRLVGTAAVATISNIATNTLTLTGVPATFTGKTKFDLVQGSPPFEILGFDLASSAQAGSTVVLSSTPPALLQVGDYVCLPGESPVPQLPLELHPVLVQAVVVKVLEALGDRDGMSAAQSKLKEIADSAESVLQNRVEGEPRQVVNRQNLFTRRWTWGAWR